MTNAFLPGARADLDGFDGFDGFDVRSETPSAFRNDDRRQGVAIVVGFSTAMWAGIAGIAWVAVRVLF